MVVSNYSILSTGCSQSKNKHQPGRCDTNICPLTGVIVLVILSQSVVVSHLLLETSKCDCGLAKHEVTVSPSKHKWFQLYFCFISRFKWLYNPKQMNLPGILGIWLGKISLGFFQSDQSSLEVIFVSEFTTIRIKGVMLFTAVGIFCDIFLTLRKIN